ncbi:hypothetical protein KR222_011028, partial [Zaprionus bogoriensis]
IEPYGLISSMENILMKVLTTTRGVNCTIGEVIEVMAATVKYLNDIDACGTAVPKDIAKIVKSCQSIISICDDIIHLNSQLCANDDDTKTSTSGCFWELFKAIMTLTRKLNTTIKLIAKLPGDTEDCFVDATKAVETSYNNFMPRIDKCIEMM